MNYTFDRVFSPVCENAPEKNIAALEKIIKDNAHTAVGEALGLPDIHSPEEYRKRVPISDYTPFRHYAVMEQNGIRNQLTVYRPVSFCGSSGSTGEPKIFPVTEEALSRNVNFDEQVLKAIQKDCGGRRLYIGNFRTDLSAPIENRLISTEILYRNAYEKGLLEEKDYVGGFTLMFQKNIRDYMYSRVWAGFLSEDITIIQGIFIYEEQLFFNYIDRYGKKILDDIEAGEIPPEVRLTDPVREVLLAMPRSPERIAYVRRELARGMEGIAKRLWPDLYVCVGISGRTFSIEEQTVRKYLGDGVHIYTFSYGSSECNMGFPMDFDSGDFVMMPGNAFYEFLPADAGGSEDSEDASEPEYRGRMSAPLLPEELRPGELYELVLTTFSGLYRYRIGDLLRCKDIYHGAPVMEFHSRIKQALNLAGEKMSYPQLDETMIRYNKFLKGSLKRYTFFGDMQNLGYLCVAEAPSEAGGEDYARVLDTILMGINWDYSDLRGLGDLAEIRVLHVSREEYDEFIEVSSGAPRGQNKPRHALVKSQYSKACEWFRQREERYR